jgi:hypothetical protein
MSLKLSFTPACLVAGTFAFASAVTAACYVSATKSCCDLLPEGGPQKVPCVDVILTNPAMPHFNYAPLGSPGTDTITIITPPSSCVWTPMKKNAAGNCVPEFGGNKTAFCYGFTVGGGGCTGVGDP